MAESVAMNLAGKGSWFGGPSDSTDSGHTANGETTKTPGIAVYNHGTLGGYWRVKSPNGKTVVLKQTDIGPAPWTGRKIDVTYSALGKLGYGEHNFPTDSQFQAEYLGRKPPKEVAQATTSLPGTPRQLPATPELGAGLDTPAFEAATKKAILGKLLSGEKGSSENPLFKTGLISTKAPNPAEYQLPGKAEAPEAKAPVEPSTGVHLGKALPQGLAKFGDKQVAAWIDPILQYAQAHGWKGSVNSGYRSKADQERIYNSGVRPAAVPGTSNHEGDAFPRGAVDVSEAQQLAQILKHSPYAGTLVWAGSKDPVHFSHPHNGGY
jgi:hypothetical protein